MTQISLNQPSSMHAVWVNSRQFAHFVIQGVKQVDFERLRQQSPFKLFVGATQASSGKLRIFREQELTVEVLLASACLPRIHHAIQIDGEPIGMAASASTRPLAGGYWNSDCSNSGST